MGKLRFSSAREVFEAFPTLGDDLTSGPTADSPLQYLQILRESGTPEDGVAFSAYVLNRRDTVWWACQCLRLLIPGIETGDPALRAAEAWVYAPDEDKRLAALRLGIEEDRQRPATWLSLAAGWSGGNIAPPGVAGIVPSPPHYTARAARIAVLSALAFVPARERADKLGLCLNGALHMMREPQKTG